MNKDVALLSVSATLLWSLFLIDVSHAVQIDGKQADRNPMAAEMNGRANVPATHVSTTPILCPEGGARKIGTPCLKHSLLGPGEKAMNRILYTIAAITATLVVTLVALIVWVLFSRRIPMQPFVRSTH
jgi:hypothetical protein